jgi:hypothetical protein
MLVPEGYLSPLGAVEYVARWRARDAVATLTPDGFAFLATLEGALRGRRFPPPPPPFPTLCRASPGAPTRTRDLLPPGAAPSAPALPLPGTVERAKEWFEAGRALDAARESARADLCQALISGGLMAVALRPSGELVTMHAADWRARFQRVPDWRDASAWGEALLARADLARWCGAPPEPEPAERPADWPAPPPEAIRRESPPDAALEWMREHARGMKRDAAIADCQRATGATYREALAAWNGLPPETRGTRGARKRP